MQTCHVGGVAPFRRPSTATELPQAAASADERQGNKGLLRLPVARRKAGLGGKLAAPRANVTPFVGNWPRQQKRRIPASDSGAHGCLALTSLARERCYATAAAFFSPSFDAAAPLAALASLKQMRGYGKSKRDVLALMVTDGPTCGRVIALRVASTSVFDDDEPWRRLRVEGEGAHPAVNRRIPKSTAVGDPRSLLLIASSLADSGRAESGGLADVAAFGSHFASASYKDDAHSRDDGYLAGIPAATLPNFMCAVPHLLDLLVGQRRRGSRGVAGVNCLYWARWRDNPLSIKAEEGVATASAGFVFLVGANVCSGAGSATRSDNRKSALSA
ncbi:hypothetical protein HPB50_007793 [Hyalomma asiaticum]|uniref:Uncharacterized protein n=1 Tax=Hyalomma asiaticum TaxID=266040 RepID=A0ACB7TGN7_HYAAI|nr:hypothetical protein HPB50_007793 [Hyalomma asiaticum]